MTTNNASFRFFVKMTSNSIKVTTNNVSYLERTNATEGGRVLGEGKRMREGKSAWRNSEECCHPLRDYIWYHAGGFVE